MRIRRRQLFKAACLILLLFLLYSNRYVFLRGAGEFLISEDEAAEADAIYVLSGNPLDRGRKAVSLYEEGYAPEVIVTGGEKSGILEAYGMEVLTCDVGRRALIHLGMDSTHIRMICRGSSTFEEYEAIKEDCKARGYDRIMVVSSRFHTRRVSNFFRGRLADDGISLLVMGAPESQFDESEWWKKEEGLIFLNNEYIKILYYLFKY